MSDLPTMRALRFDRFGGPSVLHLEEIPKPEPGAGEVLVEVRAAAINPSDAKNVQGSMGHTTLPRTPGRDFAGVVVAGPADLIGVEVWGSGGELGFTRDGSHAEYLLLPQEAVAPKPHALTMEQAAAVGVPFITAWAALIETARLEAGETLLVIGGTGAVGSAATQIAKWKGARVLATERDESEPYVGWERHVDTVINLRKQSLVDAVRTVTQGQGAHVVFNVVGGPTLEPGLEALGKRGRQVCISAIGDHRVSFDLLDFYRRELRLFGVNTLFFTSTDCARLLQPMLPGFEAGVLEPRPLRAVPLEEAVHAYEAVLRGTPDKLVITPHPA